MSNSIYAQSNEELFPNFPYFLFTQDELAQAKSRDKMHCKCACCGKEFWKEKHFLQRNIKNNKPLVYCSSKCVYEHRTILLNEKLPETYICEHCGKKVEKKDRYGSGRFCSEKCAKQYANNFSNTEEINKRKSEKLQKFYFIHPELNTQYSKKSKIRKPKVVKKIVNNKIVIDKSLQKYWSLTDIARMSGTVYSKFIKYCTSENLELDKQYIPSTQITVINSCRHALGKTFDFGSITYSDLETVKEICTKLLYEYNWSSERVCTDFLGVNIPFTGIFRSVQLLKKLNVKTKTLTESVQSYYKRIDTHKHKEPKKQYKENCLFHMEWNIYKLLYELNYKNINEKDNISRDHMVSREYGYQNNIDSYLISHPANCMLMPLVENVIKRTNCSITLGELIERVEFFNETLLRQDSFNQYDSNYRLNPNLTQKQLKHYLVLSMID